MSRKYYEKICIYLINKCQQRQTKQISEMNSLSIVSLKRFPIREMGFDINDNDT